MRAKGRIIVPTYRKRHTEDLGGGPTLRRIGRVREIDSRDFRRRCPGPVAVIVLIREVCNVSSV